MDVCEFQGIHLPIEDFQAIFNMIDYDGSGEIGYKEFCLLNTDKRNIFAAIEEMKQESIKKEAQELKDKQKGKLGHLVKLKHQIGKDSQADPDALSSVSTLSKQSTRASDMYNQIKKKQIDKPKPYAVADEEADDNDSE